MKGFIERKTGFIVWVGNEKFWHRTFAGALQRKRRALSGSASLRVLIVDTWGAREMTDRGTFKR